MLLTKLKKQNQYLLSILIVGVLSAVCYFLRDIIDYRIVALLLFLAVSILAILFDVFPVIIAAVLSALILNIFFIEPTFHYKIDNAENTLLFIIYLLIALLNAVFTNRIRKQEKNLREKEEKESTIKLYNTVLNSLSHELRIPITTIIGSVDTLKENNINLPEKYKEELLDEIQEASLRLNGQVENLLNMSRLETGNFQLKKDWTDINELIYIVLNKITNSQQHNIQFNPDENLPYFKIDMGLMEQVIHILIQNAVNYTPTTSTIQINSKEENEHLILEIIDNGKGFPEDKLELVFEKFYRLPNSKTGGTGLGLSIAKGFVEAHNGTIELKNNPEGGARVTLKIPCETSYLKNLKNE